MLLEVGIGARPRKGVLVGTSMKEGVVKKSRGSAAEATRRAHCMGPVRPLGAAAGAQVKDPLERSSEEVGTGRDSVGLAAPPVLRDPQVRKMEAASPAFRPPALHARAICGKGVSLKARTPGKGAALAPRRRKRGAGRKRKPSEPGLSEVTEGVERLVACTRRAEPVPQTKEAGKVKFLALRAT